MTETTTNKPAAGEATRVDARRNRKAVIEAALLALATDPNASMLDIANAAGLGRTTVYRHFENREVLIVALFERVIADSQLATSAVIDQRLPAEETLRELGPVMVAIGRRFRFLHAHLAIGLQTLAESKRVPDDPVRVFLLEGRESGALRSDVPLTWMQSMMQSTAMATMDETDAGHIDSDVAGRLLGETFVALFSRGAEKRG
jgi:AcrR family transcriptional regulator